MEFSEIAVENGRTFATIGSLLTLENGTLLIASFNLIIHALLLVGVWGIAIAIAVLDGYRDIGCKVSLSENCTEITNQEALFASVAVSLYVVPMIYLNHRLYWAVYEKDVEFMTLWLKVTSAITIVRGFIHLQMSYIIPEIVQLFIVHAYQQSLEIRKLQQARFPLFVPIKT